MKRRMEKLTCSSCQYEWMIATGGYEKSISNSFEYFHLLQEQQSRICPKCGNAGHVPNACRQLPGPSSSSRPASPDDTFQTEKAGDFTVRAARFTLDEVILTASSRRQINESLAKIRHHDTIYRTWGFSEVDPAGKGLILNFYGKSGTGKTLTAEAMAGSLGMPIVMLGMADVESKFMGETAKNIRKAFTLSKEQRAVLFFDEADTLLGKRLSLVTQGVDNEVNAQRSTLLMELETFEGIVIFASNFAENYDKAFENRITQHIRFDLPDLPTRVLLWLKHLVERIPLAEPREELAARAAEHSEGLVGRDVRNCLRVAMSKALLEHECNGGEAVLRWEHLHESIARLREAHREVGQEVNVCHDSGQLNAARHLLRLQRNDRPI